MKIEFVWTLGGARFITSAVCISTHTHTVLCCVWVAPCLIITLTPCRYSGGGLLLGDKSLRVHVLVWW